MLVVINNDVDPGPGTWLVAVVWPLLVLSHGQVLSITTDCPSRAWFLLMEEGREVMECGCRNESAKSNPKEVP